MKKLFFLGMVMLFMVACGLKSPTDPWINKGIVKIIPTITPSVNVVAPPVITITPVKSLTPGASSTPAASYTITPTALPTFVPTATPIAGISYFTSLFVALPNYPTGRSLFCSFIGPGSVVHAYMQIKSGSEISTIFDFPLNTVVPMEYPTGQSTNFEVTVVGQNVNFTWDNTLFMSNGVDGLILGYSVQ